MDKVLMEIGLSKNESKVYLALAEMGVATVKQVSDSTGIHRSNVYETLERLGEKGIVSPVMQEGKKYFSAADPERLHTLLEFKKARLNQIIPDLKALTKDSKVRGSHHVDVYQGVSGLKQIQDIILKEGKPVYSFGIPSNISDVMKYFVANYHDERILRKISQFHLYDEDAEKRINFLNSLPYTQAKLVKGQIKSPATTTVFGDFVTIWVWSKPEFLVLIKSEPMAQAYKRYFDMLWELS